MGRAVRLLGEVGGLYVKHVTALRCSKANRPFGRLHCLRASGVGYSITVLSLVVWVRDSL